MKKQIIIVITLLCLLLCSCSAAEYSKITNNTDDNNTPPNSTGTSNEEASPNAPDYIYPLNFDSLYELKSSISKENEEIYAKYSETEITRTQMDVLKIFVEKLKSQKNFVPCLNGQTIDFRNKEGFSNIALFVCESYNLPWIFYYPNVPTGENFYIKITYLPENILNEQKDPTASEVIKKLSPNSPNINNLGDQHKSIYNQTLKLSDREVTALVIEYKTDSRNSIFFVYEDLLVQVRCDPEVWNAQWFSALSFDGFD